MHKTSNGCADAINMHAWIPYPYAWLENLIAAAHAALCTSQRSTPLKHTEAPAYRFLKKAYLHVCAPIKSQAIISFSIIVTLQQLLAYKFRGLVSQTQWIAVAESVIAWLENDIPHGCKGARLGPGLPQPMPPDTLPRRAALPSGSAAGPLELPAAGGLPRRPATTISRNSGLQNQAVCVRAPRLDGKPPASWICNVWAKDDATALAESVFRVMASSRTASPVAAPDWRTLRVLDVASGKPLTGMEIINRAAERHPHEAGMRRGFFSIRATSDRRSVAERESSKYYPSHGRRSPPTS